MDDLSDSIGSLVRLEQTETSANLEQQESLIEPRTHYSQPSIRYSLASSMHDDDPAQKHGPDRLTTDLKPTELSDRQLSPDDDRYSSSTDFLSVVTVDDFGFASSWSRQVQKYAANDRWINLDNDSGREEQQDPLEQPSMGQAPILTSDNLRNFGDQFSPIPSTRPPTVQELSHDLGSPIDDGMRPNDIIDLCDELLSERKVSKHGSGGSKFIPHDKLCTILNDYNVFRLLKHIFPQDAGSRLRDRVAEICSDEHRLSRRMILAVLVLVDQPSFIDDFINHKIYDIDLPLREPKERNSTDHEQFKRNLFHKRQDEDSSEPHTFFEHWRPKHMSDFLHSQYLVLSPFMKMRSDRVCFYKIEESIRLPFIEYHEPQGPQVGGQGAVYKVKIHPAHHDFVFQEGDENPFFAVKAIYSEEYEHIRDEVRVLERFSGSQPGHDHIIRLLMWFKHGRKYYLLFPWAAGNLADYWKRHPLPTPTVQDTRWLIKQCYGMADGLKKIHNHTSWSRKQRINGCDHGELLGKDLGRHGDVKPENLLWFNDDMRVVIADFGLTRFHQVGSALTTPNNLRGFSRTYRPPEFSLEAAVSQKCDVWSLGCVYLEFITWYLLGHEKTRGGGAGTFVKLRIEDDDGKSDIQEDKFFNLKPDSTQVDGKLKYIADVKDSVKKWITDLRELEHCSAAIGAFLEMIEREMLVPDTHARARMQHVQRRLSEMVEMCQASVEYCTNHTHAAPVREEPKAQPAIGELRHSAVMHGPSGYRRFKGPNFEGGNDLDTFVDKELRDLGLLETSDNVNPMEIDSTGIPEARVQAPPRNNHILQDQPAAARPPSIMRRSTPKQIIPRLPNNETTASGLRSQSSRADMTSSLATSIARSSSEEIRDRHRVSFGVSAVITEADRDEAIPKNISPGVEDLLEKQDDEIPIHEKTCLSPLNHNSLHPSANTGDQSSQETRCSHEINDKYIESGLQQSQVHREEVERPSSPHLDVSTTNVPNIPTSRWRRLRKKHYKWKWTGIWASLRRRLSAKSSFRD